MKKLTADFYEHEFDSPDTGECKMDSKFMTVLQALRTKVGVKFIITSGYRTPEYNALKKGEDDSLHLKGLAADVSHETWDGLTKHRFIREASEMGFSIGIYPRHFHIDFRNAPTVLWIAGIKP